MNAFFHDLFFISRIEADTAFFDAEEAHHLFAVARKRIQEPIIASDGLGGLYECRVEEISKKGTKARILNKTSHLKPDPWIQLFIGLPDRDAFEMLLENTVPLGVARIQPVLCQHTQKKSWDSNWKKFQSRFRKKSIASMKQSHQVWLPELSVPVLFSESLSSILGFCLVADVQGTSVHDVLKGKSISDVYTCYIGPPGGFSPEELQALTARKACFVSLAPYRLKTELASVALCAHLAAMGTVHEKDKNPGP
ncbi:MAG: 16S rRNA (uracil(1498)-N(3))-methyltransferase [Candidatus Aureabacteria bacterium]|nr:16S rRNA (uracil(1498)-N(3))-methyltransferase [Candidatus Auribacterota bacterium]